MFDENLLLEKIAVLLEMDQDELSQKIELTSLATWDSLAVLGYIAIVKELYGVTVNLNGIDKAKTVQDLVLLVREKFTRC